MAPKIDLDRLSQLMRERGWKSDSALSLAAGLARGHVGFIRKGTYAPKPETVESLARVLRVSPEYLAGGNVLPSAAGLADVEIVEMRDAYPSRAPVLAMARSLGLPDAAIAAVLAVRPDSDPGEEWWTERLLHYVEQAGKLERAARRDSPSSTPPPPSAVSRRR